MYVNCHSACQLIQPSRPMHFGVVLRQRPRTGTVRQKDRETDLKRNLRLQHKYKYKKYDHKDKLTNNLLMLFLAIANDVKVPYRLIVVASVDISQTTGSLIKSAIVNRRIGLAF